MSFMSFFQRSGGNLNKKITKKIEKILRDNTLGISSYKIEIHDGLFYLKVYYECASIAEKNDLYRDFYAAFLKFGYKLHGVTEYFDNKEICYTYIKD